MLFAYFVPPEAFAPSSLAIDLIYAGGCFPPPTESQAVTHFLSL